MARVWGVRWDGLEERTNTTGVSSLASGMHTALALSLAVLAGIHDRGLETPLPSFARKRARPGYGSTGNKAVCAALRELPVPPGEDAADAYRDWYRQDKNARKRARRACRARGGK